MISEYDFQREWKRLFSQTPVDEESVIVARDLLEKLPFTSPLRTRFGKELEEIEAIVSQGTE